MGALDAEFPFPAEVALGPFLGVGGDDGKEKGAGADLRLDFGVPRVAAAQLALVEPDLQPKGPQGIGNPPSRLGILAGVTKENGPRRFLVLRHKLQLS
jgi:hypothetical protein